MINSVYIHIPFCNKICTYCDFAKIFYNKEMVDRYLCELEKEIDKRYKHDKIKTIYIGGGTPSSLNINQLEKLFKIINKLDITDVLEYTIECNFDSIDKEKLLLFKKYGINRLSFGLETISNKLLKFLGRDIDKDKVIDIIKFAKEIGFNNINIDLMYALVDESIDDLDNDLDFILSLDIEHISTYSLIIEDNTILSINNIKNIDEEKDLEMYKYICNKLKNNGYLHYEISNFSKEGYYSIHNTVYWDNKKYYGFGLGSASYIDNCRINNTKSFTKYLDGLYINNKEYLSKKDIIRYEILLNLRKSEGINLSEFRKKYNYDLNYYYDYKELIDNKLLICLENYLFIPEDKWYISNSIIVKMFEMEK